MRVNWVLAIMGLAQVIGYGSGFFTASLFTGVALGFMCIIYAVHP